MSLDLEEAANLDLTEDQKSLSRKVDLQIFKIWIVSSSLLAKYLPF